jgi:hypothetical protein
VSLLNLTPAEFCSATNACKDGRKWALTQPTMADVWDNCPRSDWLLWIADKVGNRPDDRTRRLFAVWCARNTPLGDGRTTGDLLTDPRSRAALELAERYAEGRATADELDAARAAAWDAARYAGWDAAWAAGQAATQAAARDAAGAAAWDAAWDAARAAARAAAGDAAGDAARAAERAAWAAQADHLCTLVTNPFRKEAKQ